MNMDDETPTHFCQIISSKTLRLGKLQLPTEFVRKYGEVTLSGPKVLLGVPTGDKWCVRLQKSGRRRVFLHGDGWQRFMQHYSLAVGNMVLFRPESLQSVFSIVIFNTFSTEIDYPPAPYAVDMSADEGITSQDSDTGGEEEEEEVDDDLLFPNTGVSGTLANPISVVYDYDAYEHIRKRPSTSSKPKPKDNVRVKKTRLPGSSRTSQAAEEDLRVPSFHLKIRRSYLERKSRVTIPGKFVEANNLKEDAPLNVFVRVLGSTKRWQMQYYYRENEKRGEFSNAGWHTFRKEVGLCKGDICEFELTARRNGELFFTMARRT